MGSMKLFMWTMKKTKKMMMSGGCRVKNKSRGDCVSIKVDEERAFLKLPYIELLKVGGLQQRG